MVVIMLGDIILTWRSKVFVLAEVPRKYLAPELELVQLSNKPWHLKQHIQSLLEITLESIDASGMFQWLAGVIVLEILLSHLQLIFSGRLGRNQEGGVPNLSLYRSKR